MSLRKKIVLGILAALILAVGAGVFWFWDDIGAVVSGLRYSTEELEQQLIQNEQIISEAVQIVPDVVVRELTEEEKQALKAGTVTKEELIQNMIEPGAPSESAPDKPPVQDTGVPPKQEAPPETVQPVQPTVQVGDYQKKLAAIIAEVYVLREEFLIKLDNLMAEAKAEYLALPAGERTSSKLSTLAGKYFTRAYNLELECDARMKEIIARMKTLLSENGGDLSIADAVLDTYLKEKSLKKSWYLAELRKRGI